MLQNIITERMILILMIFSTERRQKDNRTTNTPPRTTKHKTSSPGKRGKPSPRKRKTPPRSKNEVKKDRPPSRETNTTVSPRRRRKRHKKKRGKQGEENISSASSEDEDDKQCVSCHQPVSGAIMFAIFYFVFTYFVQHIRYATHTGYAEGHYVSCEECHGTLHPPSHENGFCLRKKDGKVFCSKRSLKTQTLTSNNQLTRTPNI